MAASLDLSEMTFVAIQAALQAGEVLNRGFGTSYQITAKPGRQNIVTEFDHLSENTIISAIKHRFPTHSFLAEESGHTHHPDNHILWIIDPLDGTTNFAHQIPLFTISLAAYRGEEGLCGVIYQPVTKELFVTQKGKGAFLNGNRLSVSTTAHVEDAIIGASLPANVIENPNHCIDHLAHFTHLGVTLRNLGSAALMLAYVAAGKLDGFWMDNLYPWDLAAGKLLVKEAGGLITNYTGIEHPITEASSVVASNRAIQKEMLTILKNQNSF